MYIKMIVTKITNLRASACMLQITHNLNGTRTCLTCHTHGILALYIHTCVYVNGRHTCTLTRSLYAHMCSNILLYYACGHRFGTDFCTHLSYCTANAVVCLFLTQLGSLYQRNQMFCLPLMFAGAYNL